MNRALFAAFSLAAAAAFAAPFDLRTARGEAKSETVVLRLPCRICGRGARGVR